MIGRNVTAITAIALFTTLCTFAKDYRAERYLVNLNIEPNGTLDVTETVTFHFEGGPFTFVYRDISATETDGITDIAAWIDGHACAQGVGPGDVTIRAGKVRWNFAPVSDQSHTFTIRYRALGVIRKGTTSDKFRWHALPDRRSYRIDMAEVRLVHPQGVTPPSVTIEPDLPVEVMPTGVLAQLGQVRAGTDVILDARFARGSFACLDPKWSQDLNAWLDARRRGLEIGVPAGIAILIAAVYWTLRQRSRWPPLERKPELTLATQPPSPLGPALAARLVGTQHAAYGALMDLVRRGVVRIEEVEPGSRKQKFRIARERTSVMAPHEQALLAVALREDAAVPLEVFQQRVTQAGGKLSRAIRGDLKSGGLYHAGRVEVRSRMFRTGWILGAVGFAGCLLAVFLFKTSIGAAAALGPVALGLLVAGIVTLIVAATVSPLTEAGALAAGEWRGFGKHLRETARGRSPLPAPAEWDRILPYAAAFGIAGTLVERARKQGSLHMPAWFGAWQDDAGADAFVSFLAASDAAGSAGGADGGGGGASGGGSSGAG